MDTPHLVISEIEGVQEETLPPQESVQIRCDTDNKMIQFDTEATKHIQIDTEGAPKLIQCDAEAAILEDWRAIEHMEQTPDLCGLALSRNVAAYQYMDQTEELSLFLIRKEPIALAYVEEQTEEMCLEAVRRMGLTIQFAIEQTPVICEVAVTQDPLALEFAKFQNEEMCMDAIRRNGLCLRFVKEKTPMMYYFAVRQNGLALEFVPESERSYKLCRAAIQQNPDAGEFVTDASVFSEKSSSETQP